MSATLFMESTEISAEQTVTEIEKHLTSHGAAAVLKEYEAGGIQAVSFKMRTPAGDVPFRLPCRWQAIETILAKRNKSTSLSDANKFARREKAKRVAWRQILRWIQAQMALVETNMVQVEEVFFPYIQAPNGQTLYERHADNLLQLPSGQ